MISYAVKRLLRSFGLFAALFLGVMLATTFFAGINIGADTTAKATLLQQLNHIPIDITVYSSSTLKSNKWKEAAQAVGQVEGIVKVEVVSRATLLDVVGENYTVVMVSAISDTSKVYDGLNVVNAGKNLLGVNETYVWVGSKAANKVALNDTITLNFTYYSHRDPQPGEKSLGVSLKIVGFVELDDKAYSIATGLMETPAIMVVVPEQKPAVFYGDLLLIASWEKTFARILDSIPEDASVTISTQILAYIDRDKLINPWDIPSSMEAVAGITRQVSNAVAHLDMYANNNLGTVLMIYQFTSAAMRFAFIIAAIPVFFVAWYVGTTVSEVSYNLRRREIGLLLTKGFSNSQIFRLFLSESIMIGILGGLAGVGLGFLLGPLFVGKNMGLEQITPVLSTEVIVITMIFGLALTLLSTFRPSRRAAKLPVVEALREYTYIEEVKPHKQRLPWIAFSLGLYKIVMFLLGISSLQSIFRQPPFTNIFLLILLGIWIIIDIALIYIGPLLFFWGFTKIFIRDSMKFQGLVARAAKFLGDLGTLATKNVQRNPVRAASIAFLVALIVSYSFQTIGGVVNSQDYNVRRIKAEVGADINVQLAPSANITEVLEAMEGMTGKASTTVQYFLSGSFPGESYTQQITAIDPETWLATAYYEEDWFSGRSAAEALQIMKTNSQTIILEQNVASRLKKKVGDTVTVNIGYSTLILEVVGLFGRELPQEYTWQSFQSFISVKLYESLNLDWQSPKAAVLVKLKPESDGKVVASEIRKINGVSSVRSVAEELEKLESNLLLVGPIHIQKLGVVFSILASSVAVGLATLVSLQERKREASIMWARGLSFKQLLIMLLTENLAVVAFAVFLGVVVGIIVVHGNVAASNAALVYTLVKYRMVFPPDAVILLVSCLLLIFASTVLPTVLLTKRYISKVERIVRL